MKNNHSAKKKRKTKEELLAEEHYKFISQTTETETPIWMIEVYGKPQKSIKNETS